MVPRTKEELSKLVTEATVETYEELTPQLIQLIDQTKHNENLTEAQKQDEISLHMLGYVKSCTNEIIIDVLAEILGLDSGGRCYEILREMRKTGRGQYEFLPVMWCTDSKRRDTSYI